MFSRPLISLSGDFGGLDGESIAAGFANGEPNHLPFAMISADRARISRRRLGLLVERSDSVLPAQSGQFAAVSAGHAGVSDLVHGAIHTEQPMARKPCFHAGALR